MVAHPKTSKLLAASTPPAPPPIVDGSAGRRGRSVYDDDNDQPSGDIARQSIETSAVFEAQQGSDASAIITQRPWWQYLKNCWDARRAPAFLVSLIFHTTLLLLLALLSLAQTGGTQRSFDFVAARSAVDQTEQLTSLVMTDGDLAPPAPVSDTSLEPPASSTDSSVSASTLAELLREQTPPQMPMSSSTFSELLQATANSPIATFAATGVQGRQIELRRQAALARGGTIESEKRVELALDWLAMHQLPSGGWSLVHDGGKCNGRCPNNGSHDRFDPAATGLSLLAFLGAGYTHREGKHRETVRQGIYFLQQIMEETPQGGSFLHQSERGMYNHGIAAFALCEAYQLTQDKDLKDTAQKAIDFIVSAQNYQGGWGYLPKQPGDLTLSGWQIMALKSAYAAGLDVPPSSIVRIDPFLDSQQLPTSFFYGYGKPGKSTTCTTIGLLLRLFRGLSHTHPTILDGASFISKSQKPGPDAYFNYYSSLFLFHVGGPFWEGWNEQMREHLIATQATSGHMAGSWFFEDPYGREGGRLYTTAMSAMTLEVYYRFAPLYQQANLKFEL